MFAGSAEASRIACSDFIKSNWQDNTEPTIRGLKLIWRQAGKYLDYCRKNRIKKPSTLRTQKNQLKIFSDWGKENNTLYIEDIDVNKIREFMLYFQTNYPLSGRVSKRPNPNHTWNKYKCTLTVFLKYCGVEHPPTELPEFKLRFQHNRGRVFTRDEIKTILEYFISKEDKIAIAFYYTLAYAGLRPSEALGITWRDVKNDQIVLSKETKTYQNRSIPIAKELAPHLKVIKKKYNTLVFNGITADVWRKKLYRALRELGIEQAGLYAFRHSFGTAIASSTKNPKNIQELLGHSTINTSLLYIHVTSEERKEAIDSLDFS